MTHKSINSIALSETDPIDKCEEVNLQLLVETLGVADRRQFLGPPPPKKKGRKKKYGRNEGVVLLAFLFKPTPKGGNPRFLPTLWTLVPVSPRWPREETKMRSVGDPRAQRGHPHRPGARAMGHGPWAITYADPFGAEEFIHVPPILRWLWLSKQMGSHFGGR